MSAMVHVPVDLKAPRIERGEMCDGCRVAQAYVRVAVRSGVDLDFCAHDFAKHEKALRQQEYVVTIDQREDLRVKLGVGMAEGIEVIHPSLRDKPKREGK